VSQVIKASGVSRSFGNVKAVDGVDFQVESGSIIGLIGPNGAGKTTLLRALLGLTRYRGDIDVLGCSPLRQRAQVMEQVCFIADTAVLPRWMRVAQLLDYVAGVHPRFDREHAQTLLADTDVALTRHVGNLSKGMMVQLHLALVMAIDARLLILDEPTLGLDILFRKRFFEQILADYHHSERTIIISTHQVEEVENILTDVMFMDRGKLLLQQSMVEIAGQYVELHALGENVHKARGIPHLGQRVIPSGVAFIYRGIEPDLLAPLGELRTPTVADLFVALLTGEGTDG
jgi:ABC-2 type transport system ATP-binding protein